MTRVLIVEDNESSSRTLAHMLEREGFDPTVVVTGSRALTEFDGRGAEVVLLDLVLPDMPGTEVCRALRGRSDVPIVMLSARDAETDKITCLDLGADDYVTKPYSARELVARMRAVLRRRHQKEPHRGPVLSVGPVRMDVNRRMVVVDGRPVPMPPREFELLELLMRHAGNLLHRDRIIDTLWGANYRGDRKTLDTHVKRLRAKIETHRDHPRHLLTVRGVGYKFEP